MSTKEATLDTDPLANLGDALETAAETLGDAATNARESATVAARKVKKTARSGVYHAAYGLSFGVVFAAVFVVELLPEDNLVRRGLEDGAEAGFDSAVAKSESRQAKRRPYIEKPADVEQVEESIN